MRISDTPVLLQNRLVYVVTPNDLTQLSTVSRNLVQAGTRLREAKTQFIGQIEKRNEKEVLDNGALPADVRPDACGQPLGPSSVGLNLEPTSVIDGVTTKAESTAVENELTGNGLKGFRIETGKLHEVKVMGHKLCYIQRSAKPVKVDLAKFEKGKYSLEAKIHDAGSGKIVVVHRPGVSESPFVLAIEDGELVGADGGALEPGLPQLQSYELGDLVVYPFGSKVIVQGNRGRIMAIDMGADMSRDFVKGEVVANGTIALLALKTKTGTFSTVALDARNGHLLRGPFTGNSVAWTDDAQQLVGVEGGRFELYPPLGGKSTSVNGSAVFSDPSLVGRLERVQTEVVNLLERINSESKEGDLQVLRTALERQQQELPQGYSDAVVQSVVEGTQSAINLIGSMLENGASNERMKKEQLSMVQTAAKKLRTAVESADKLPEDEGRFIGLQIKLEAYNAAFTEFDDALHRAQLLTSEEKSILTADIVEKKTSLMTNYALETNLLATTQTSEMQDFVAASNRLGKIHNQEDGDVSRKDVDALLSQASNLVERSRLLQKAQKLLKSSGISAEDGVLKSLQSLFSGPLAEQYATAVQTSERLGREVVDNEKRDAALERARAIRAELNSRLSSLTSQTTDEEIDRIALDLQPQIEEIRSLVAEGKLEYEKKVGQLAETVQREIDQRTDRAKGEKNLRLERERDAKRTEALRLREQALRVIKAAKTYAELRESVRGYDPQTKQVTGEAGPRSRTLHEALAKAEEAAILGAQDVPLTVHNSIKVAYATQDCAIYEQSFFEGGIFHYSCPQWNPRTQPVPLSATRDIQELSMHTVWNMDHLQAVFPGLDSIARADKKIHEFSIDGSELDEFVAHDAQALAYSSEHIRSEETLTCAFLQFLFEEHQSALEQKRKESSFLQRLMRIIKKHEGDQDEKARAVSGLIGRVLRKQFGEEVITDHRLEHVVLLLMSLCSSSQVPETFEEFFSQDSTGLLKRYLDFDRDYNVADVQGVHRRRAAYKKFALELTGLDQFTPAEHDADDFIVGGIQVLRAVEIMAQRDKAKSQKSDCRGMIIKGLPGSGKTRIVKHLERVEQGRSVWVNATALNDAKSWDPWDMNNSVAARQQLMKFWLGMISGWNVTVDEAHNISDDLLHQLKKIIEQDGTLTTSGSPEGEVDGFRFSPLFPRGDYRLHPNSVLTLIMNEIREIGLDGRFIAPQNASREATLGAMHRRLPMIYIDAIDQKNEENRLEVQKDYLRRACINDGLPRKDLMILTEIFATHRRIDAAQLSETVQMYGPEELRKIEKRLKNRWQAVQAITEIQFAVYRNGMKSHEELEAEVLKIAQSENGARISTTVEPPCYLTGVGPSDIEGIIAAIDENSGDEEQVAKFIAEKLEEKHGDTHGPDKRSNNKLWIGKVLNDPRVVEDYLPGTNTTAWEKACDEAKKNLIMSKAQNPEAQAIRLLGEIMGEQGERSHVTLQALIAHAGPALKALGNFAEFARTRAQQNERKPRS